MLETETIEDVVKRHLNFQFGVSGGGWHKIYCEVCGDGTRTKGPRGGWLFSGEFATYRCFNCGCKQTFDAEREHPYSKGMWDVFERFGIPKDEHTSVAYKNKLSDKTPLKPIKRETPIDVVPMPDHWYKMITATPDNIFAQKARSFLWDEKRIDPSSYDFYLSSGITRMGPVEEIRARSMVGKLIIPFFRGSELIFYQVRDLDKKKYINPPIPRSNLLGGIDKLSKDQHRPLYVTEGFWDCHHLDGVCCFENHLTNPQIDLLKRSNRRKIIVPDKKDDSQRLANQAIDLGWEVALPDIGNFDDVTAAIVQYGKYYVLNSINENIISGENARIRLGMFSL